MSVLDSNTLIKAYSRGVFPMADEDGVISWYESNPRAILEFDDFRIPRDLKRIINQNFFEIHFDREFERVMHNCSRRYPTWISEEMIYSYAHLHRLGRAHSVEAWQGGKLVGGLYGVALGGAFFGESMFYHVSNASKVAMVSLVQHLKQRGYVLHDAQMMSPIVESFGAKYISREDYLKRLKQALQKNVTFM